MSLTVVGGCYTEVCLRPSWRHLYGSGVRAAAVARRLLPEPPVLVTAVAACEERNLARVAASYDFHVRAHRRAAPAEFQYDHPLAPPRLYPALDALGLVDPIGVSADSVLAFGLIETATQVRDKTLVYDPQAGGRALPPSAANAADRLAIVANLEEVRAMLAARAGGAAPQHGAAELGGLLLTQEGAAAVVVKNGVEGAVDPDPANLAGSLLSDAAGVQAALGEPWSIGQVEGQVNRLKVIERQMYGRAGIKLLRARVRHKG